MGWLIRCKAGKGAPDLMLTYLLYYIYYTYGWEYPPTPLAVGMLEWFVFVFSFIRFPLSRFPLTVYPLSRLSAYPLNHATCPQPSSHKQQAIKGNRQQTTNDEPRTKISRKRECA